MCETCSPTCLCGCLQQSRDSHCEPATADPLKKSPYGSSQATGAGFCVPGPIPWRLCDPWRTSHQNMQYQPACTHCPTHAVIQVLNTSMSCLEEWLSPKVERSFITELFPSQKGKVLGPAVVPRRAVEREELFSWEHTLPQKLTITVEFRHLNKPLAIFRALPKGSGFLLVDLFRSAIPKAVKINLGRFMGEWHLLENNIRRNHFSFWCTAILRHVRTEFIDVELGLLLIKHCFQSAAALLTNKQSCSSALHHARVWLRGRSMGRICLCQDLSLPWLERFEFAHCSY